MENSININIVDSKKVMAAVKSDQIQEIDKQIEDNKEIKKIRAVPYIYIFMVVLSIISGFLSSQFPHSENLRFTFSFITFGFGAVGIFGIVIPRRILNYIPSHEKIARKQYYIPSAKREEVMKSLNTHSASVVKLLEELSSTNVNNSAGSSTIKVILYYTKTGSFISGQVYDYVPYEFVPRHAAITYSVTVA